MKLKLIIPLISAILIGFISAKIVYNFYDELKNNYNAYFLQVGAYSNNDTLNTELKKLSNYVTDKDNNVTYVYVGITTNKSNAEKIKNLYTCKNMDVYIKPVLIDNIEFYSNLEQYDVLLSSVDKESDVLSINEVILSDYKEIVLQS